MESFFQKLMQGISLESHSQKTIRQLEEQQRSLADSYPEAALAIASSIERLKANFSRQGLAVEPYDKAINSTLDNLQNDPDLALDSFNVTIAVLLKVVSQGHYTQDSASLKSLLADFIEIDSPEFLRESVTVDMDTLVKKLKPVMESAVQNNCLSPVIQEYLAGEKDVEAVESALRSGASLAHCTYPGFDKLYRKILATEYSTSDAMQYDLKNGHFIKKIKSLGLARNPLFSKLDDYLLDYTTETPTAIIDSKLINIHLPRGSRFPGNEVLLDRIDLLEKYHGIKLASYINHEDIYGNTLLHKVAPSGDKKLVERLLEAGADPARYNHHGALPKDLALHSAEIRNLLAVEPTNQLTQAVSSAQETDQFASFLPAMTPKTTLAADQPLLSKSTL